MLNMRIIKILQWWYVFFYVSHEPNIHQISYGKTLCKFPCAGHGIQFTMVKTIPTGKKNLKESTTPFKSLFETKYWRNGTSICAQEYSTTHENARKQRNLLMQLGKIKIPDFRISEFFCLSATNHPKNSLYFWHCVSGNYLEVCSSDGPAAYLVKTISVRCYSWVKSSSLSSS